MKKWLFVIGLSSFALADSTTIVSASGSLSYCNDQYNRCLDYWCPINPSDCGEICECHFNKCMGSECA